MSKLGFALGLVALCFGCSHEREAAKPAGGSPEIITGPTVKAGDALSDPQIAAIVRTINNGEVEAGQLAKVSAVNDEVREFANMMVADHSDANEKLAALTQKLQIVPSDSEVLKDLKADHMKVMERLRDRQGEDFDGAYMAEMVDGHAKALRMIDDELLPSTKNGELHAAISEMRPTVVHHLERARKIVDESPVASR